MASVNLLAPSDLRDTLTAWRSTTDDVLEFIDDEPSRELCRIVMECNGNMSAAARRLGVSEGIVRYRLAISAVPHIENVVAHLPAVETPPINRSPLPTVKEATDAEFFPQLCEAADRALRRINGTR